MNAFLLWTHTGLICISSDSISLATWDRNGKPFYDQLISKLEIEESWDQAMLKM